MNKHKKLFSFIVSLAMCSSLVPMSVSADTADIDYSQTHHTSIKFEPVSDTPEQHLFSVENSTKNYILLDSTTVDGKREFFVMTDYLAPRSGSFDATAVEEFTDGGNCYRFVKKNSGATWNKDSGNYAYDPQNPNSIAYFINSDAFTNVMIDSSVDEYVQSHTWKNEPVWSTGTGNTTEFTVSEYALPSISEYLAYSDKIGSKAQLLEPNGYYYHWYFRSPFADGSASSYIMYKDGTYIRNWSFPDYWDTSLRPAFYLSEDFFKNVKLDTSDLGKDVISTIDFSSFMTKEDALSLGYTEDEWNYISLKASDDITLTSNGGDRVKSGYTLTVNGIDETDTVSYYSSATDPTTFLGTVLEGITTPSFTLTNDLEKKYITAVVETSDGSRYITNTVYCDANLPSYTGWINNTLVNPNDDASWKMKLVGQPGEFTIVDYDENSKEMLIMSGLAVKSYEKGSEQYTSTENIQIYDETDPNSIAYRINQTSFIDERLISEEYINYIPVKFWETEKYYNGDDFVSQARVALPSLTELKSDTYKDRIGYVVGKGTGEQAGFKLRTPYSSDTQFYYIHNVTNAGSARSVNASSTYYPSRVELYLNSDILKEVKLDFENSGSNTIELMKSILTPEQGVALYGADVWECLFPADITGAVEGSFTIQNNGKVKSGYTLSVAPAAEVSLDDASIQYIASADGTSWVNVSNATATDYTITNDKAGKQIAALITVGDTTYITDSVTVGENLEYKYTYGSKPLTKYSTSITDNKIVFKDGLGKEFILLGSDSEKTFLLAINFPARIKMYDSESPYVQKYDSRDEKSIAYKINEESYINANILPAKYSDYILTTPWETAASPMTLSQITDETIKAQTVLGMSNDTVDFAKLAVPSFEDLYTDAYQENVPYNILSPGFYTRTAANVPSKPAFAVLNTNSASETIVSSSNVETSNSNTWFKFMAEFYVDNGIFKTLAIDMEKSGQKAKDLVSNLLTEDEYNKVYYAGMVNVKDAVTDKIEITSNGKIKSGYTVSVTSKDDTLSLESADIKYLSSDDQVIWYDVDANADTYTIKNETAGKYLAALVTVNGTKYLSNILGPVEENLTYEYKWQNTYPLTRTMDDPDFAVKFEDAPSSFILVEKADGKALYLSKVTGTESYYTDCSYKVTNEDGTEKLINAFRQIYNSKDADSIAYKMNQASFISDNFLPEKYHDYIEVTPWETEGSGFTAPNEGDITKMADDTVDFAKIAYPSLSELQNIPGYKQRVGYNESNCGMTLRTPKQNDIEFFTVHGYANGYISESSSVTKYYANRSQMYLDDSIYKSAKIDVANSGVKALAELNLPSIMSIDEAKALGYNTTELALLGFNDDRRAEIVNLYTDSGVIKADIEYVNYGAASSADVLLSVYGADNRLKTAQKVAVTLDGDKVCEVKQIETTDAITLAEGDYIKMFVWEGKTIRPIANAVDKSQEFIPEFKAIADGNVSFENTEFFAFNGRWLKTESGMVSNWVRPYVEFDVVANDSTSIVVNFTKPDRTANIKLFVNGACIAGIGTVSATGYNENISWDISEYLTSGANHIRLMNTSSSQITFKSVDVTAADGYLTATPKENNILFIGDSISEQEGYTLYVPMALNADFTTVAKSGIAFLNGHFGGGNKDNAIGMMDKFYHYESISDATTNVGTTPYDFENGPEYSAIVINIGTNDPFTSVDTELSTSPFATQYDAFLKDLSAKYPNAEILVVKPIRKMEMREDDKGYSNDFRNQIYDKIGEQIENGAYGEKVHFVDTWEWDITMSLSESIHPNNVGYNQMSSLLIDYMTQNGIIK